VGLVFGLLGERPGAARCVMACVAGLGSRWARSGGAAPRRGRGVRDLP